MRPSLVHSCRPLLGECAVVLAMLFVLCCAPATERESSASALRLATTTSTYNSGLLQAILPPFEAREEVEIQVLSVGTGQALALGERGDVDVVLVHARRREDAFVFAGHGLFRRDVMWNDFVMLGPPDDPAGLAGGADAAAALTRLRDGGWRFVSRGDDSGTHIRELELWDAAGGVPAGESHYLETGQGMGSSLVIADEKRAYILADRGTFLAFETRIDLQVVIEGDPRLRNPYGVIPVNPELHPGVQSAAARRLVDYLTSPEGQRRIGSFRVGGQVLFHPVAGIP